jgi:hypothetical protein
MATGTRKSQIFENEREFLNFSRAYLSQAFPNPDRKGCPADEMLRLLANRPTKSDISIIDHVTCCSPCFNAYMAHLGRLRAELRSRRIRRGSRIRRSLLTAGSLAMVVIAIYVLVIGWHSKPILPPRIREGVGQAVSVSQGPANAVYLPVSIDLSSASPVRGAEAGASPKPQVIPSNPLTDLSLRLPLGSEDREYSVMLSGNRRVVWSRSAPAHLENGQMFLHMHADFSNVPAGNYDLMVVSSGVRLSVPVLVKSTWSRKMQ